MTNAVRDRGPAIDGIDVAAYTIPTDAPESDGTLRWSATTLVTVSLHAGGRAGLGYTYASAAVAVVVRNELAPVVIGAGALDVPRIWESMRRAVRNVGRPGIAACAISAVDTAAWDLKARLLDVSLLDLLGAVRDAVPVYGSGGFTSMSDDALRSQLERWADDGIAAVKMKVGRDDADDALRVRLAREIVGPDIALMVDANGAWTRRQALRLAFAFAEHDVRWLEEPVSSDDLDGLRFVRERAPHGLEIAAGEYGYDMYYFQRMIAAQAVDVLQADITRCSGLTGLLRAATLCEAQHVPLSTHTAPALHLHAACCLTPVRHVEYFHDHVRIERMLFDGVIEPAGGRLRPDRSVAGHGLAFRHDDAARFRVA